MNDRVKATAALMALAGWILLVVATASAFSVGASLWLSLSHASLVDSVRTLPWRNAGWALLAGGTWLVLRKLRLRIEARISAEPRRSDEEAMAERVRNGRIYQWFLIVVTSAIVLSALGFHRTLGSSREGFNEILLGLLSVQALVTAGTFAFFAYGVDIRRLFARGTTSERRKE
ncbi:MAG: hypothetical protein AB7T14_06985 [Candidatus Methylacidiphilaceae bacterium]